MKHGKHVCIRCEQEFTLGSVETCPRAPDRGEHETIDIHIFQPGRLDGLCALPATTGGSCGYAANEDFIHAG